MNEEKLAAFLQEHPRMTTVLFAALLLLTQGAVLAENNSGYAGP